MPYNAIMDKRSVVTITKRAEKQLKKMPLTILEVVLVWSKRFKSQEFVKLERRQDITTNRLRVTARDSDLFA
jgi:mRNA-degrading endonuclease RelE of RelBE toxin-antitoxin system